jgi:hypothetical protein
LSGKPATWFYAEALGEPWPSREARYP